MTIQRTKGQSSKGGLAILLNNVNGSHSYLESKGQGAKIVDFGGGLGNEGDVIVPNTVGNYWGQHAQLDQVGGFGTSYGEWTIVPTRTFNATVKAWGAGGGNHSHGQNASGGGGGHARSEITFLQDIPYTFWVGQGGSYTLTRYGTNGNRHNYRTSGTFGNGGGGGTSGGSGGGLSGIFFNTLGFESQGSGHNSQGFGTSTENGGVSTWFRTPSQNNALLIAGGGGGTGHSHTTSHHGQGGGGGGTAGNVGHNSGGGTQTAGGAGGYNSAQAGHALHGGSGGNASLGGGGGGGWFGGGGGGHSGSHYNGGGGGSGHALDLNSSIGYKNYWIRTTYGDIAKNSYIETSPSSHSNTVNMAAGRDDTDWAYAGVGAGFKDINNNLNTNKYLGYSDGPRSGNNGRIVIRVNE